MSQTRFVNKDFGSISLNNDQLTTYLGQLFIDNNPVTGSSVNYTTSGNVFHTFFDSNVSISGGNLAFFADTTGNLITDADIYLITSTPETANFLCGGSSGSILGAPEMPNMIYLGDDAIQLAALNDPNTGNIISVNSSYTNVNNSTGISIITSMYQQLFISSGNFSVTTSGNIICSDIICSDISLNIPQNQGFNSNQNINGWVNLGCDSFTQGTNITTSVGTANLPVGKIYTQNTTLGNQSTTQFFVSHNYVGPNSIVIANILNYTNTYGTHGLPSISINGVTTGGFSINIINYSTTTALSGNLTIGYQIHSPENENN